MRKNQWFVLAYTFLVLMIFFIYMDISWGNTCNLFNLEQPLNKLDLSACIQAEIFEPFIWLFFVMWIVCSINGWVEGRAERKR